MNTKILGDFQICISGPSNFNLLSMETPGNETLSIDIIFMSSIFKTANQIYFSRDPEIEIANQIYFSRDP